MSVSQGAVDQLLRDNREQLPRDWFNAENSPRAMARVAAVAGSLLAQCSCQLLREALPDHMVIARGGGRLWVAAAYWEAFAAEFASQGSTAEVNEALAGCLRGIDPEPTPTTCNAVWVVAALARHDRAQRRAPFRCEALSRDPRRVGDVRWLVAIGEFVEWAGGDDTDEAMDMLLHGWWKPLAKRSLNAPIRVPREASAGIALSSSLLRRRETPQDPPAAVAPYREPDTVSLDDPDPVAALLRTLILQSVEPLLTSANDPLAMVTDAINAAEPNAADLLRPLRRALATGDLELFGKPGTVGQFELPHPDWEVISVAQRESREPAFRVVRRGVRLADTVLLPGRLVYAPRGSQ